MLKWFPNSVTSASGENLLVHHLPRFFKDLPPLDESVSYLYGWLAGYFAADGCVAADGTVILNSADRADLEFVRTVCTRLGIGTYGITTQMREGFPGREPSAIHRVHLVNEDLRESFFLLDPHRDRFVAGRQAVRAAGLGGPLGGGDRPGRGGVLRRGGGRARVHARGQHPHRQLLRLPGRRRRHLVRDEARRADLLRRGGEPRRQVRRAAAPRGGRRQAGRAPTPRAGPRPADRGQPARPGVLRRSAADPRGPGRAHVPHRARLRRGGGGAVRHRLRAPRRRGAAQAPPAEGVPRGGAGRGGPGRGRPLGVRPFPRAAAVADPRGERRHHRLRGPADLRRRPDRREVPQHPRDRALQEEPGPLRHRPGPPRHRALVPGRGGRGLHRRDGLPPRGGADGGRHLRHRLR